MPAHPWATAVHSSGVPIRIRTAHRPAHRIVREELSRLWPEPLACMRARRPRRAARPARPGHRRPRPAARRRRPRRLRRQRRAPWPTAPPASRSGWPASRCAAAALLEPGAGPARLARRHGVHPGRGDLAGPRRRHRRRPGRVPHRGPGRARRAGRGRRAGRARSPSWSTTRRSSTSSTPSSPPDRRARRAGLPRPGRLLAAGRRPLHVGVRRSPVHSAAAAGRARRGRSPRGRASGWSG